MATTGVNGVIVRRSSLVVLHLVELKVDNAGECDARIELYPAGGQHKVDVLWIFVAPEFDHAAQIELGDDLMLLDERVHVRFEALVGVDALAVELDFDEGIGVGADNEVYFGPVNHDYFFDVVDHVCKLCWSQTL